MYNAYYSNYDVAIETIDKIQKSNEQFAKFLEERKQQPECKDVSLHSRLIMPVQVGVSFFFLFPSFCSALTAF